MSAVLQQQCYHTDTQTTPPVAVVGAGADRTPYAKPTCRGPGRYLLGLEAARGLQKYNTQVTIFERANRMNQYEAQGALHLTNPHQFRANMVKPPPCGRNHINIL